jgi:hypothetical protein
VKELARKKYNPADSLGRFMIGIYDYYTDRGLPQNTAKARMVDNTLNEVVELIKQEKEVPDHMLVIMAQFMSRALNTRGAQITKIIQESDMEPTEEHLKPLRDIKPATDAINTFIENYKGWSESDGES